MKRVYLDYNATTPLRPEARAAMIAAMDVCGNPSSVHAEGRAAKAVVETARRQVLTPPVLLEQISFLLPAQRKLRRWLWLAKGICVLRLNMIA